MAALMLFLPLVSCVESLDDGTTFFYNFSPVTVTELKIYDSVNTGSLSRPSYNKKDLVYAYPGGIKTGGYHEFVLKEGDCFFEVKTEEGEVYEGGPFSIRSYRYHIVFSVDYDLLEYDL
jgi:hypothetical protein